MKTNLTFDRSSRQRLSRLSLVTTQHDVLASYRCRFVLEWVGEQPEEVSVGLYLVETRDFAERGKA